MSVYKNLLGYWKMDESSGNAIDSSNNSNTGTNVGSVTYGSGLLNNAATLGNNKYFTISNAWSSSDASFSISAWIKPSAAQAQYQTIIGFGASANAINFIIQQTGGAYLSRLRVETSGGSISGTTTLSNSWYHVVATCSSGTWNIYLNGTNEGSGSGSSVAQTTTLYLGRYNVASINGMLGQMDEVGIWNRVLTSGEVTTLYNSGTPLDFTPNIETSLINYYKLDESSGNATDSVGSNTGVNTNVTYSTGKINNGALFSSSNDGILTFGSQIQPTSISFWLYGTKLLSGGIGYTVLKSTSPDNSIQSQDTTGKILIFDGTNRVGANTWATGSWNHYVFIYNYSGTAGYDIYLNGSFLEKIASNPIQVRSIGRDSTRSFGGTIDEVGFWDRSLSGSEVTSLYNSGSGLTYPFGTAYSITATKGTFTLTGIATLFNKALIMAATYGSYVYTGIDAIFARGKGFVAETGIFTLTGNDTLFSKVLTMLAGTGTYVLTGVSVVIQKGISIVVTAGSYVLTGFNARFPRFWTNIAKSVTSWINNTKNSTTWNNQDKSDI